MVLTHKMRHVISAVSLLCHYVFMEVMNANCGYNPDQMKELHRSMFISHFVSTDIMYEHSNIYKPGAGCPEKKHTASSRRWANDGPATPPSLL